MNYKAIDLGATAYKKVDVPPTGPMPSTPGDPGAGAGQDGQGAIPSARWTATACLVSALSTMWTASSSSAPLPEKRGVAVSVPTWGCREVHPVQPVRLLLPARHHPSLCLTEEASSNHEAMP